MINEASVQPRQDSVSADKMPRPEPASTDGCATASNQKCCKSRCKKMKCGIFMFTIVALIWFAVDDDSHHGGDHHHHDKDVDGFRSHGWPRQCFPQASSGVPESSLSSLSPPVWQPAFNETDCAEQAGKVCGDAAAATSNGSLASLLRYQTCLAANLYSFSDSCRAAFNLRDKYALFPSTLGNSDEKLRETAIKACKHDAHHHCHAELHHFNPRQHNLCQMNDIGMCLASQAQDVSKECSAAIADLGISAPSGYDRATYVNAKNSNYSHHGPGGWKIALWVVLSLALFGAVAKGTKKAIRCYHSERCASGKVDGGLDLETSNPGGVYFLRSDSDDAAAIDSEAPAQDGKIIL